MTKKRANGEGWIQRRGKRFRGLFHYKERASGTIKTVSITRNTKRDVMAEWARRRIELGAVEDPSLTVGQWLKTWFSSYLSSGRATTKERYETIIRRHLEPGLGGICLIDLTPDHVATFQRKLGRKLGSSTVNLIRRVLNRAISQAVESGKAFRNVLKAVPAPKPEPRAPLVLSKAQSEAFRIEAKKSPYWPVYCLCLATGMRRGEALAMKWSCVSFDRVEVTIKETASPVKGQMVVNPTKTKQSRRTVPISQSFMADLQAIRGNARSGLVAVGRFGGLLHPETVREDLRRICARAGLPLFSLHCLRHTHASILLQEGVPLPEVSRRLGHSSIRITADIYGHIVPGEKDRSAQVIERIYNTGGSNHGQVETSL